MTAPDLVTAPDSTAPDGPATLSFRPGDETWQALRHRYRRDFYRFVADVIGMGPLLPMRPHFHRPPLLLMAGTTGVPDLDDAPYKMVRLPRDTGKSACITKPLPLWRLLQQPRLNILLAAQKVALAEKFLGFIKDQLLQNELLRALFPEITPDNPLTPRLFPEIRRWQTKDLTWKTAEIEIPDGTGRGEPSILCTGVGGSVTGFHPGLILCDDLIAEDEAQAMRTGNTDLMQQAIDWVKRLDFLVDKNAKPRPEICIVGTSWWVGDVYDYLEQQYSFGEPKRQYRVTVKDEHGTPRATTMWRAGRIAVHTRGIVEDGHSILPDRYSDQMLAMKRIEDPVLFAANMMNAPADDATAAFKESWLGLYHWIDHETLRYPTRDGSQTVAQIRDLDVVIAVDPGGFKQQVQLRDRMRAAAVISATTPEDLHLFLRAHSEPETYLAFADRLVVWCQLYQPRKLGIEQAGQQIAFLEIVRQKLQAAHLRTVIEPLKPGTKDKKMKILELEPYLQRGQILVSTGPEWQEFREQFRQFPRGTRVDLLDAASYLPRLWRKPAPTSSFPQQAARDALLRYRRSVGAL